MFERFTERAREVVVLAQEDARLLGHGYIGTEHVLLGLLREQEGLAARVLESLDITVERARAQVVRIVGSDQEVAPGQIPFTPRAKKVFELALREALSLGHNYIGTEHLLLGLGRENEGVAARILLDFDADSDKIREGVLRVTDAAEQRTVAPESTRPPDALERFLEDIEKVARLTAQEEVDLAKRIERGDLDAKQEMVDSNLRLVTSVADDYRNQGRPFSTSSKRARWASSAPSRASTTARARSSPPTPPGGSARRSPARSPTGPNRGPWQDVHAS